MLGSFSATTFFVSCGHTRDSRTAQRPTVECYSALAGGAARAGAPAHVLGTRVSCLVPSSRRIAALGRTTGKLESSTISILLIHTGHAAEAQQEGKNARRPQVALISIVLVNDKGQKKPVVAFASVRDLEGFILEGSGFDNHPSFLLGKAP